ncbi:MAG: glycoside hydrolase TIM-barrel-like domain-containing protein [Pseudoruegeria sp.]
MATIALAAVGAAVGGAVGGTAIGLSSVVLGQAVGGTLGRIVDQQIMGSGSQAVETGRIDRFRLTGASEGAPISQVFGRCRVSGQVIWSTKFKEAVSKRTSGGKGTKPKVTTTSYTYSVSAAIALCEGTIGRVGRVWADGAEVDLAALNMRVYPGDDTQMPDPKIEAIEGTGLAPAYRGVAYVVFEDLDLTVFGNRFPQFTFEVHRPAEAGQGENDLDPVHSVNGVALIPGTGEYTLATQAVGYSQGLGVTQTANGNTPYSEADFETSLRDLREELPNCGAVSLVVSWFGDDLRAGQCAIRPRVEQTLTEGDTQVWEVSGLDRATAGTVPYSGDRPLYGGTPSDASVLQAIAALQAQGQDVMFYPFILMEQIAGNGLDNPWNPEAEQPALPWRGRITSVIAPGVSGTTDQTLAVEVEVSQFFGTAVAADFTTNDTGVTYSGPEELSYRRFILHYAHLCAVAGGVEAFCIGSEMRGLTQIRGASGFPAVDALKALAGEVRLILGPEVKISYAADWSEYFGYQPQDGSGDVYFQLDDLWADPEIDFIGIDNYMPMSDWRDGEEHLDVGWGDIHNLDYLYHNVCGGEGFDWYYHSVEARDAQIRTTITDGAYGENWVYRYKDIRGWWQNAHHQRVGGVRSASSTNWVPQSKPIRFTEYGCAAIHSGTNQPNKFLDPKSSESSLAYYSNGARDELIQLQYLRAFSKYWGSKNNNPSSGVFDGRMLDLEHSFVWAWDARPYPFFPNSPNVWSDGDNYARGHWLNGRTAGRTLASVITEICECSGIHDYDVSQAYGYVRGYSFNAVNSGRAALQPLLLAYGIDAIERDGVLVFRNRTGNADATLLADQFALTTEQETAVEFRRSSGVDLAGRVRLNYIEGDRNYEVRAVDATFPDDSSNFVSESEAPLVLTQTEAKKIAERWLSESRIAREGASFALPPSALALGAGDVVELPNGMGRYRLDQLDTAGATLIEAQRVEPNVYLSAAIEEELSDLTSAAPVVPVFPLFLDIPLLTGDEIPHAPHVAATVTPWPGSVAVYSSDENDGYSLNTLLEVGAIIGVTETSLLQARPGMPDLGTALRVKFYGGDVETVTWNKVLSGANAVAIGDGASDNWEIIQFEKAKLVAPNTYELSNRLRGQQGSEINMPDSWPIGSYVVLLDLGVQQISIQSNARNLARHYRIGPSSQSYDHAVYEHRIEAFSGVGLKPYAPAHLRVNPMINGDWGITWIRRGRIESDNWDGLDIPLGEENEAYLLRILDGETIIREVTVETSTWTYSQSDQAVDGALIAPVVSVAQISAIYGAGAFKRKDVYG